MGDWLFIAHLVVSVVIFFAVLLMSEKPYGRGTTGKPDFEAAFFLAIVWPGILLLLALALLFGNKD